MQSRRDQAQAYFFVVGRLVAALTHGKPDLLEPPNRRLSNGTIFGLLLAALLVAIFGIYGLFVPGGNTSWQQVGSIIVEKETGARYLYLDGHLRPVLNYTSALLAVGTAGAPVVSVSQSSLRGVPVGAPIGIPNAPDSIPPGANLDTGPWTVCMTPAATPQVTLLLGGASGAALADGDGMLVSTSDGTEYLLAQGRRYRLVGSAAAALGYSGTPPMSVSDDWLNPIPAGSDLTVPDFTGVGAPGPIIAGRQSLVGAVYEVRNSVTDTDQFYVVRSGGLSPLSHTTAALLLGSTATQTAYPNGNVTPIQVGSNVLTGVSVASGSDLTTNDYPRQPPTLVDTSGDALPCVRFTPGQSGGASTFVQLPSAATRAGSTPVGSHLAGATVDQVEITEGTAVLARDLPTPGAAPGTEYLVTETGEKYPLSNTAVAGILGYQQSSAVDIPNQLLALLPTGPLLSTSAALAGSTAGS
jgi:type VII secretion protein EccB